MPALPRPFGNTDDSASHKLRWIVLIAAALAAVAWRTQSVVSGAPRRLKDALGGAGGEQAATAAPPPPSWSPEAAQQDRLAPPAGQNGGSGTPPAANEPVPDASVPAQPAVTQPEGGVPAPQVEPDQDVAGNAPGTSHAPGGDADTTTDRSPSPAASGPSTAGRAPGADAAAGRGPEIAPSGSNQAAMAANGEVPAVGARPQGIAAQPTPTQPGEPPATSPAGEDAGGTFRPTKAEPDAFGVVVVDDAPAGLAADKNWVEGSGGQDCPEQYPIKGNANSRIYHRPGESSYAQTIPELCFASEQDAVAAGYRPRAR